MLLGYTGTQRSRLPRCVQPSPQTNGSAAGRERGLCLCKPFTGVAVRYFDHEKLDEARVWLEIDGDFANQTGSCAVILDLSPTDESRGIRLLLL